MFLSSRQETSQPSCGHTAESTRLFCPGKIKTECSASDLAQPAICSATTLCATGLLPLSSATSATSVHCSVLAETTGRKKRNAAVATVANIPPIAARGRSNTNRRRDLSGFEANDSFSDMANNSLFPAPTVISLDFFEAKPSSPRRAFGQGRLTPSRARLQTHLRLGRILARVNNHRGFHQANSIYSFRGYCK